MAQQPAGQNRAHDDQLDPEEQHRDENQRGSQSDDGQKQSLSKVSVVRPGEGPEIAHRVRGDVATLAPVPSQAADHPPSAHSPLNPVGSDHAPGSQLMGHAIARYTARAPPLPPLTVIAIYRHRVSRLRNKKPDARTVKRPHAPPDRLVDQKRHRDCCPYAITHHGKRIPGQSLDARQPVQWAAGLAPSSANWEKLRAAGHRGTCRGTKLPNTKTCLSLALVFRPVR